MAQEMVVDTGVVTHETDNSWRFAETPGGVVTVTIDPSLFVPNDTVDDDGTKKEAWLTGYSEDATTVWIRSGTPLAKLSSGDTYGPWDNEASDGRNGVIAGLLESDVELTVSLGGVKANPPTVGMRYRGDIIVKNLHVDVSGATWGGDFYDIEVPTVTPLSGQGGSGSASVSVDTLSGATAIGKQLMKAADAEAARTVIGAQASV